MGTNNMNILPRIHWVSKEIHVRSMNLDYISNSDAQVDWASMQFFTINKINKFTFAHVAHKIISDTNIEYIVRLYLWWQ